MSYFTETFPHKYVCVAANLTVRGYTIAHSNSFANDTTKKHYSFLPPIKLNGTSRQLNPLYGILENRGKYNKILDENIAIYFRVEEPVIHIFSKTIQGVEDNCYTLTSQERQFAYKLGRFFRYKIYHEYDNIFISSLILSELSPTFDFNGFNFGEVVNQCRKQLV
jgi:hypothetical protein